MKMSIIDQKVQDMVMQQEVSHAKKGLWWGVISGATWGLDGVVLWYFALVALPFWNDSYPMWIAYVLAPVVGAAMHDGFAGLWLFLYNLFTGRAAEYMRVFKTKPGRIVVYGAMCGGPIAMSGYLIGAGMAPLTYALAITACYPAVGAILALIILKEKIVPRVWLGIILCIAGAIVITYVPPEGDFPYFYLGLAFSLLATFGWGAEGVLSTFGMDMVDPAIAIGIRQKASFVVYMIVVVPLVGIFLGAGLFFGWGIFGQAFGTISIVYLAIAGFLGGLSYLAWYRALNMTGVGRAMSLNITYALWSIIFLALFGLLGIMDPVSMSMTLIIGAIMITLGAVLVCANPKELVNLRNK